MEQAEQRRWADDVAVAFRVVWRSLVVLWVLLVPWVAVSFAHDESIGPVNAIFVMTIFLCMAAVPVLVVGGAVAAVVERLLGRAPLPVLLLVYAVAGLLVAAVAVAAMDLGALGGDAATVYLAGAGAVAVAVARWWVHDADARLARRGRATAPPGPDEAIEDALDDATRDA
ncbi:hypothetical protein [Cellulomonas composti]|uniref:Uncharacterized protein n=1 Tax=Cellulomonas composti TaxID=266130 RepID=A0A511JC89_9CELL|nr:hypothetical protein [Cellulomonas composti]GEL95592.1 hypothetical protein CCO02nite_22500 [Cellulomonas composti]